MWQISLQVFYESRTIQMRVFYTPDSNKIDSKPYHTGLPRELGF